MTTVSNGVDRINLFSFFNHEFERHELFVEAGVYHADSVGYREEAPMLGAVPIVIPASNYYNPFGPVGSPNRLPASPVRQGDLTCRWSAIARSMLVRARRKSKTSQLACWPGSKVTSPAGTGKRRCSTRVRIPRITRTASPTRCSRKRSAARRRMPTIRSTAVAWTTCRMATARQALASTIDDITVNVYRRNSTSLASWDAKFSRPDLVHLWAGDVGIAAGVELRRETFSDDRDPRLDGTINFVDSISGLVASDVMGQSGTLDTKGSRNVSRRSSNWPCR